MKTRSLIAHGCWLACLLVHSAALAATISVTLPEYSGGSGTVGQFGVTLVPGAYVVGGRINGAFGNSQVPSSSGADVYLNSQLVGRCGPFDPGTGAGSPCNFAPAAWSSSFGPSTVSGGSNTVSVVQTSPFVVRLAPTTVSVDVMETAQTQNVINNVISTLRNDPANAGKSEKEIAELAFSALTDARHGFYGINDEFGQLRGLDSVTLSNADHYFQVYAMGLGNSASENPLTAAIVGAVIDPAYNLGKEIAQTVFGTTFFAADEGPQSPANFDFWGLSGALSAIGVRTGLTPNPIQPVVSDAQSSIFVEEVQANIPLRFDPVAAPGFEYTSWAGPLFASVLIPNASVPGLDHFFLDVGNLTYTLRPDELFSFDTPVNQFTIRGISGPFVGVADFVTELSFAGSGIVVFEQRAIDGTPVPEPSALLASLLGLLVMALAANQRRLR